MSYSERRREERRKKHQNIEQERRVVDRRVQKKCLVCGEWKDMTKHHIFPKTHFQSNLTIEVCRECHDVLEKKINLEEIDHGAIVLKRKRRKLKEIEYIKIVFKLLKKSTFFLRALRKKFLAEYLGGKMKDILQMLKYANKEG